MSFRKFDLYKNNKYPTNETFNTITSNSCNVRTISVQGDAIIQNVVCRKLIGEIEVVGNITINGNTLTNASDFFDMNGVLTIKDISNQEGLLYLNKEQILTEKSIIIDTVKYNIRSQLQEDKNDYFNYLITHIGKDSDLLEITGDNKWGGAVISDKSQTTTIYMIPANSNKILLFEPYSTNEPITYEINKQATISDKWRGAIFSDNGLAIGVPYNHNSIITIVANDPIPSSLNDIVKYYDIPENYIIDFTGGDTSNNEGWISGASSPNNNYCYMAPGRAKRVLIFDYVTKDINSIELPNEIKDISGIKYSTSILNVNKNIYMFPRDVSNVLIIDTNTNDISYININIPNNPDKTTTDLFYGGVLATNKKMYITPFKNRHILEFDPVDNSYNFIQLPLSPLVDFNSGKKNWMNAVLSQNGKVYAMPHEANVVLEFDPITHTTRYLPLPSKLTTQNKYCGGILTSNQFIYGIPSNENRILDLQLFENMTNNNWMTNAYFNKV